MDDVLTTLKGHIKKNPKLKILKKVQLLLENTSVELILVQGSKFRAWNENTTYHFNRNCKNYPERVKPDEIDKILYYDSHEEAAKKHRPCKTCLNYEKLLNNSHNNTVKE